MNTKRSGKPNPRDRPTRKTPKPAAPAPRPAPAPAPTINPRSARLIAVFAGGLALAAIVCIASYLYDARAPRAVTVAPTGTSRAAASTTVERLVPRIHARFPHDPRAFTQGLVWDHGRLFESTGLRGQSSLREVELASGVVRRRVDDDPSVFGEGLALVEGQLFQLTWRNRRAIVWGADDFALLRDLPYEGEGWGLCYDGRSFVMSDGSDTLQFRNKTSFALERSVKVTRQGQPQKQLNELECVSGRVFANVWQSDEIVRIDPATGRVEAVVDAAALLPQRGGADVLNGIAYVPETGRFLLTGKLWPTLFEVSFEPLAP